jgi:hypothetical protein
VTGKDRLAAPALLDVMRACYGGLLLAAPRRAPSMCTPRQASPRALAAFGIMTARQLRR